MRRKLLIGLVLSTAVVSLQIGACDPFTLIPPQTISLLGEAGLSLGVTAGEASKQAVSFTLDPGDLQGAAIAGGTLEFDPSEITLTPGGGANKGSASAQTVDTCPDACVATGLLDITICNSICNNESFRITAWTSSQDDANFVCNPQPDTVRDTYGPFDVTLDENLVAVSIDPALPIAFQTNTQAWLDEGGLGLCIEVIAGFNGEVTFSSDSLSATVTFKTAE